MSGVSREVASMERSRSLIGEWHVERDGLGYTWEMGAGGNDRMC